MRIGETTTPVNPSASNLNIDKEILPNPKTTKIRVDSLDQRGNQTDNLSQRLTFLFFMDKILEHSQDDATNISIFSTSQKKIK